MFIEDEHRRPYVQFLLNNQSHRSTKPSMVTGGNQYQSTVLRCDLHDRASQLTRDIQRAREIFEEERLTYIPPDGEQDGDDDDDDGNDISGEQPADESVQMS